MSLSDSGNPSPPELPQESGSTPKSEKSRRSAFIFDRQGWTKDPMTTSASQLSKSESTNNGAFGSSLPRWRLYSSMLNWRRDPGYEQRMMQRRKEIKQIKSETEQLKLENAKLRELNANGKELLSSAALLCSPPDINLIPPNPTVQD